jgi:H+/Cl- antiporter ClcA
MGNTPKVFLFMFTAAFVLGVLAYWLLRAAMPDGVVFASLPRMIGYHWQHPYQYIAVVAVVYALIGTLCAYRWPHIQGRRRRWAIVGIMVLGIVAASAPAGALWKIHDMQAGHFTSGPRFREDLVWGVKSGLELGWLVVALSVPYNIICLAGGYWITARGFVLAADARGERQSPASSDGRSHSQP